MPTFTDTEGAIEVKTTVKDGTLVEKRTQDVEPILDLNRKARNAFDGYSDTRDLQHVAFIPNIVLEQWAKEGFDLATANPGDLERKLNDPAWAYLRTGAGRL